MNNFSKKNFDLLIIFILFLTSILIIGRNLNKPFVGIHDWNGARYGYVGRGYLKGGFFTPDFHTHYPPLLPILISVSYRIFGISEWGTRLVPLLATSGTIVVLYLFSRTIFDNKIGVLTSLLALAAPMVRYYGKNPVHEPLALFFGSIAFLGVSKVLKKEKLGWKLIYLGSFLALLATWSGIFLVLGITAALFRKVPKIKIYKLWFLSFILVFLYFFHTYLVTGSFVGGGLFDVLLQRTSLGGTSNLTQFTLFEFIERVRLWSFNLFTISLVSFSFLGLFLLFLNHKSYILNLFIGILIYSLGYPLAFPNATFIHEYFIFYLLLPTSLFASFALSQLFKNKLIWSLASIVLVLLVYFERSDYLKALEESRIDSLAVQIGKELNQKIPEKDVVLITPYAYAASRLPHLAFYSDRKITLEPDSSYNWLVEIDEKDGSYEILRREK